MTSGRGKRLTIAGIAVLLLGGACGSGKDPSTSTSGGSPTSVTTDATSASTEVPEAAEPTVTEGKLDDATPALTIDVTYPVLTYPGHQPAADQVNHILKMLVDHTIAGFRKESADLGRISGAGNPTSTLETRFDTVRLDGAVASFRMTSESYYAGAAHPASHVDTATFELSSGKQLALADLFAAGAAYLDVMGRTCAGQVEAALAKANGQPLNQDERNMVTGGTAPNSQNYAAWAISSTAVEVTFQEYQVGPYAVGRQSCEVPRAALAGVLKAGGPL